VLSPRVATALDIFRGTRAGAEEPIPLATNTPSLTYLDSAVVSGTRYFYRVAATHASNGCRTSPLSNEASARPTDGDPAAAFAAIVQRDNPWAARSLADHLQNPAEFWRPNVIPALAADEPGYTPHGEYWNGAVWAPTNYMVLSTPRN
jgi:hypothetical protein